MTPPLNDQASAAIVPFEPVRDPSREAALQKIDTIREILVGDQLQNLNVRFQNLERSQEAAYAKIGNDLTTKFEALKVLNKSEIDDLGKSVAEMLGELQKEDTAVREEIKEIRQQLAGIETRVEQVKNELAEEVRKLKDQSSEQIAELSRLVKSQREEAARQNVSRTDFAKILNGLAGSLAPAETTAPAPD